MTTDIRLRPAGSAMPPCKICSGPAPLFGADDLNRSCLEHQGLVRLPRLGLPVHYQRCADCGFLFTASLDDWTEAEFKQFIYNDDYIKVDPDYLETRPASNAAVMIEQLGADRARMRILDYGGGNGLLARRLRDAGFAHVETYDPFTPEFSKRPATKFDLISSFETFEHLPDPLSAIDTMVDLLTPAGIVMFSTLLQPPEFDQLGMTWWYIGPRNGHVSLFSAKALAIAWQRHGFTVSSLSPVLHLAFRKKA